jgi:hypothetical protein
MSEPFDDSAQWYIGTLLQAPPVARMAALSDKLWEVSDIVAMVQAVEACRQSRRV